MLPQPPPPREREKEKKMKLIPPPSRLPPKLPKISVVNKSQNEEEAFELRSYIYIYIFIHLCETDYARVFLCVSLFFFVYSFM